MRLRGRIRKLEQGRHCPLDLRRCPECGHLPGGTFASDDRACAYEVVFAGDEDQPEFCPRCGTRLVFTLTFDEMPERPSLHRSPVPTNAIDLAPSSTSPTG